MGHAMRTLITVVLLLMVMPVQAVAVQDKPPRLKFKNGPVCMCSEGLTEKDIRAALEAQHAADKNNSDEKIKPGETSRKGDEEGK